MPTVNWTRVIGFLLIAGLLTLLVGNVPTYSFFFTVIHGGISLLAFTSGIVAYYIQSKFLRLIMLVCWLPAFGLMFAIRFWETALGFHWLWLTHALFGFVLTIALPFINPKLSETLWWEQMTPKTKAGQWLFIRLPLILLPLIGIAGGLGMQAQRHGLEQNAIFLISVGLMTYLGGICAAFFSAYEYANNQFEWNTHSKR